MSLLELFCDVDDFMMSFEPQWKASQLQADKQRKRPGQLCPSEVMTLLIHFHQSHYRTFKAYYTEYVQVYLISEFPCLVSYTRFVALIPQMMLPLLAYLQSRFGTCTGISFIDSTSLAVCDPKRISGHRVFAADAKRGKTSMGWFFGFKLHLAVNDHKLLLRKRNILESIIDQLKNISQIEHSCHRSPTNFVVHLIAGLLAYSHQEKKPGLHLDEYALLAA